MEDVVDPEVTTVITHMGWKKSFHDLMAVVKGFVVLTGGLHVEMSPDPEDENAPSTIAIEVSCEEEHEQFRAFRKAFHRTARLIDDDLANRLVLRRG